MRSGESVVVLDVRPEEEYRAGHIPGARSVPVERLEAYVEELPQEREIVAYCRGPYCVFSDEAVALLSSRGYRARRPQEGLPDWRARSLSVYRFWRDLGYAVGALSAGIIADTLGISWAIGSVGALTFISGAIVAVAIREPKQDSRASARPGESRGISRSHG